MARNRFSIRWLLALTMLVAIAIALCLHIFAPPSVAVAGDPQEIVNGLVPPISKGDHYLKPSASTVEFVWLFGAYNNGRKEENALVENDGENIRYRSYWLNSDGKLWCLDVALTNVEWTNLSAKLKDERVATLPNLVPNVSHAMTYWLKFDAGKTKHDACVYGIELMDTFSMFRGDQKYASNWRTIVDCLLQIRENHTDKIRSAEFLPDGTVDWNSSKDSDAQTTEIFNW